MNKRVKLEDFSLLHLASQMREFNENVTDNKNRLIPWFWWARRGDFARFRFVFNALVAEQIANQGHQLPYNKKFIIRHDNEFAGVIGLDNMYQDATRIEMWLYLDYEYTGQHIASTAIKKAEEFADSKSVYQIVAKISPRNADIYNVLVANKYRMLSTQYDDNGKARQQIWIKTLNDKRVEK